MVVDSSNNFLSNTAGYSKSRFQVNVPKNASNKIIFQIFAFFIFAAGYTDIGCNVNVGIFHILKHLVIAKSKELFKPVLHVRVVTLSMMK